MFVSLKERLWKYALTKTAQPTAALVTPSCWMLTKTCNLNLVESVLHISSSQNWWLSFHISTVVSVDRFLVAFSLVNTLYTRWCVTLSTTTCDRLDFLENDLLNWRTSCVWFIAQFKRYQEIICLSPLSTVQLLQKWCSYGYAEMVGWGSRKERTQIHEETDQDATDSDPRECVWVYRRGTNGWVGVCVILRSVFLLPSKWRWLSSRCRTDSCCHTHTHTTCQLSWSDNVLFNEANWETSQYAAVSACVCVLMCILNIFC